MPNLFTVVAKIYPKPLPAPHLAAFQEQRKDLVAKPVEVEIYRSLTD